MTAWLDRWWLGGVIYDMVTGDSCARGSGNMTCARACKCKHMQPLAAAPTHTTAAFSSVNAYVSYNRLAASA